jgi:predicted tellurium resistance membrane protein TerC
LILKLLTRWPAIVYIGAGVIAWTSARMVTEDDLVKGWFDAHDSVRYLVDAVFVTGIVALGWWAQRRDRLRAGGHD